MRGKTPELREAATFLTVFGLIPKLELNKLQLEALIGECFTSNKKSN